MTTNHHTPLAFAGPLTAAAMEAPLGQLDAAIAAVIATGSGTSTTLTAQALAGQASLTVASSAGFLVGDPIYIGTGATFEARIIATVPNATTITVTVNLTGTYAAGQPVSKSPVELVDARSGYTSLGGRIGAIEGRVFDVKKYGAKGDGATDDRAAIQAAIDAASAANGGTVFMPSATYAVLTSLNVPSNVTLAGVGRGSKLITTANVAPVQIGVVANAVKAAVRDLWIVGTGNPAHTANRGILIGGGGFTATDVLLDNLAIDSCDKAIFVNNTTTNLVVSRCVVGGDRSTLGAIDIAAGVRCLVEGTTVVSPATHGIDIRGSGNHNRVVGCHVDAPGNTGIVVSTGPNYCVVTGNTVRGGQYGIIVENGSVGTVVEANTVLDPTAHGILVSNSTGDAANTIVIGNSIRNAGQHGIFVNACNYPVIEGNRVSVYASDGIRVSGAISPVISGNSVTDGSTAGGRAIIVTSTSTHAAISGNIVRNNVGYGIYVDSIRAAVTGNTVVDADSGNTLAIGGIVLTANASRTVVSGNVSVSSTGTTKQDYGVIVQAGCTNALLVANILYQNQTGAVSDAGTGTTQANNVTA